MAVGGWSCGGMGLEGTELRCSCSAGGRRV